MRCLSRAAIKLTSSSDTYFGGLGCSFTSLRQFISTIPHLLGCHRKLSREIKNAALVVLLFDKIDDKSSIRLVDCDSAGVVQ